MGKIAGRYPGGPRREPIVAPEDRPPPRLSTVEQIEERRARGSVRHKRKSRRKRVLLGLVGTVVAALAVGGWVGWKSHRSAEEITNQMETDDGGFDFENERDRLLRELWKMEEMERLPSPR